MVTTATADAFNGLCCELRAGRGRPALVPSPAGEAEALVGQVGDLVERRVSIGELVVQFESPSEILQLLAAPYGDSTLLADLEVLFAPSLAIDVLSQLRRIAQRTALVIVWPGRVSGGRLSYSLPGRADHVDEPARDLVVLRPVEAVFPDEIPYTVERYPA